MNTTSLKFVAGMSGYIVRQVIDGITEEECARRPQPAGNSMGWVLGHIVFYRNTTMDLLGMPRVWTDAEAWPFERGVRPEEKPLPALRLSKLMQDFDRSQERMVAGIERLSDAELAREVDGSTLGEKLAKWQFHEAYHVGQLGLLRRLLGKSGAIG